MNIRELLRQAMETGLAFKESDVIFGRRAEPAEIRDAVLRDLDPHPVAPEELLAEFRRDLLPLCKNEASPHFLGFADTGDEPAAMMADVLAMLTQQNMINQSFDSPVATFVEIAVLRWMRTIMGYRNPAPEDVQDVFAAGGVLTTGGTMSNTVAMMLARERHRPGTREHGVTAPGRVIVPAGIGHYSVVAGLSWIGVGSDRLLPVPTIGHRYDLAALADTLAAHRGDVMAVVAYAGDARTQTVENLDAVRQIVRATDPDVWLHADACWGLVCGLTPRLAPLIAGIEGYDSITVDPHKVLAVPYAISALLVRRPEDVRSISSHSDLIMEEPFALGQTTPFLGSRGWTSLKLYMALRAHGTEGLRTMVEDRLTLRDAMRAEVLARPRLVLVNEPDMMAVVLQYRPEHGTAATANAITGEIHRRLLAEGRWYLHTFTLPDDEGVVERGAELRVLRMMAGNRRATGRHVAAALDRIVELGRAIEADLVRDALTTTAAGEGAVLDPSSP